MNSQMEELIGEMAQTPKPNATPPLLKKPEGSAQPDMKLTTTPEVKLQVSPEVKSVLPAATAEDRLDLNTATLEQLVKLKGIGPSKAKAILDYRMQKGPFKRIDELTEVKGIGEKMLEKLKPLVYVALP
ncbi:helix-hairpin-helix domain-containing protein [Paenibacillus sp. N3.4]|nr:helix-hairpin-helix domain-containing protein [Paenibacillus sp. N3.4]